MSKSTPRWTIFALYLIIFVSQAHLVPGLNSNDWATWTFGEFDSKGILHPRWRYLHNTSEVAPFDSAALRASSGCELGASAKMTLVYVRMNPRAATSADLNMLAMTSAPCALAARGSTDQVQELLLHYRLRRCHSAASCRSLSDTCSARLAYPDSCHPIIAHWIYGYN